MVVFVYLLCCLESGNVFRGGMMRFCTPSQKTSAKVSDYRYFRNIDDGIGHIFAFEFIEESAVSWYTPPSHVTYF